MTGIYLAARYSRRAELCGVAEDLRAMIPSVQITSRWLAGGHQIDDDGLSVEAVRTERERFAREDWDDLMAADWCISFTEPPRSSNSRGGRHVEFGAALALGHRCIVVGPRENVFHCLHWVEVFSTWDECRAALHGALESLTEPKKTHPDRCPYCFRDALGPPQPSRIQQEEKLPTIMARQCTFCGRYTYAS